MRVIGLLFGLLVSVSALRAQDTLRVQIHGSVLDARTETPILEALVEWYDANGKRQAITQTNSEGSYAFLVRTTGSLELRLSENGYLEYREVLTLEPGECAREHVIRLVPK
jgi:hypothetical protein